MAKIVFEAPVFTVEAALAAAAHGVERLELCADYSEGGTTPSPGSFTFIKSRVNIPVFVMIRPRGADFVYTDDEIEVMEREISIFKTLGADGFVFGALTKDGAIDQKTCQRLLQVAKGKPCTFHRAFDASRDWQESLHTLIRLGFQRVLSSGCHNTVSEGMDTLVEMMKIAENQIIIMPGGGLKPEHLPRLMSTGNLKEMHASCKRWRKSQADYQNPAIHFSMDENGHQVLTINQEVVATFRKYLQEN